jgi:DNA-directed RNA polymerase specialized sigma24 family protein
VSPDEPLFAARREAHAKEAEVGKVPQEKVGVPEVSEAELEVLVQSTCAGSGATWSKLWLRLEPEVERAVARPPALGSLARDQDAVHTVVLHVMGELHRDDFRLLRTLGELAARRDGSWPRWLWTISTNAARNHVRDHAERLGRDEDGSVRLAIHTELPDEQYDVRADPSAHADAHRILAEAPELLTAKQMTAVAGWLVGDDEKATSLVRSGLMRLRRHYAGERSGPAPADAPVKARRARANR